MRPADVKPITFMKNRAAELVATVGEQRRPVVITQNGEPKAVVLDVKSYQRMQDTLSMLKLLAQSEEDFRAGRISTQEEVSKALDKRLGA